MYRSFIVGLFITSTMHTMHIYIYVHTYLDSFIFVFSYFCYYYYFTILLFLLSYFCGLFGSKWVNIVTGCWYG